MNSQLSLFGHISDTFTVPAVPKEKSKAKVETIKTVTCAEYKEIKKKEAGINYLQIKSSCVDKERCSGTDNVCAESCRDFALKRFNKAKKAEPVPVKEKIIYTVEPVIKKERIHAENVAVRDNFCKFLWNISKKFLECNEIVDFMKINSIDNNDIDQLQSCLDYPIAFKEIIDKYLERKSFYFCPSCKQDKGKALVPDGSGGLICHECSKKEEILCIKIRNFLEKK